MSFDLAIWVGEEPASDADARRTFDGLFQRHLNVNSGDPPEPPDPRLAACVREITGRYSDGLLDTVFGPVFGSVWTSTPLEPCGPIVCMNLVWGVSQNVLYFIALTAAKHGLVCYDPQASALVHPANLEALRESHGRGYEAFQRVVRFLQRK
jgi:hypothetical protein